MTKEIIDVSIRPILCATIAKKFVLIKYPIESGIKTVPICHFSGFRVAINQIGRHGSRIAIAIVETKMAPTISNMMGSDSKLV